MALITNDDLSWMRDTLEMTMPGTCYILSETLTSDGMGGGSASWGTVGTSICRLDIKTDIRSGNEMQAAGGYFPFIQTIITMPHDTVVTTLNRIEYGSDTYNVVTVFNNRSWHADTRCTLERV